MTLAARLVLLGRERKMLTYLVPVFAIAVSQ